MKPVSTITDEDFQRALSDALARLGKPTAAAALLKALPKTYKRPVAEVTRALDALAKDRRIFVLPVGKAKAYADRDPAEVLRAAIHGALSEGPATKKQLGDRVKRAAPGFEKGLGAALAGEMARGVVRDHPKVGKLPAKVGLGPPDATPFVAKAIKELKAVEKKLAKSGVTAAAIVAAIGRAMGVAATAEVKGADDGATVLAAIRDLAAREPPGALLSVRAVRGRAAMEKARFDHAMLALADEGTVALHHHDYPAGLPEAERAALVVDAGGVHYVGVTLRGAEA